MLIRVAYIGGARAALRGGGASAAVDLRSGALQSAGLLLKLDPRSGAL